MREEGLGFIQDNVAVVYFGLPTPTFSCEICGESDYSQWREVAI